MPSLAQKSLTLFVSVLALAAHVAASSRFGLTPSIGPLLSPFEGFWQNAEDVDKPNVPVNILAKGLQKPATIRFDSVLVPHIEAATAQDLYYAQGYVCASLRLWQMDFIARAASGRMAEVFGEQALEYDRFQRRFGMGMAAEASLKAMLANPDSRIAVEAYTQGANAYISSLDLRQMPVEFKILGYQPELWTPLKTAYLLKYMAYNLTGHTDEAALSRARSALGPGVFNRLYPTGQDLGIPVIPSGTPFSFKKLPISAPDSSLVAFLSGELVRMPDRSNGSNNWALAGKRTRTGKPLLANDPHLGMQLPSLWIRMELQAPGISVSGMTLPGAPSIIIGHNQAIAWGGTNAEADVLDLYKVTRVGKDMYLYKGKPTPFKQMVETILVSDGTVFLDTVLYTEAGPLAFAKDSWRGDIPNGMAVSWAAHQPSDDLGCFLGLAKARTQRQAETAIGQLACPAQNVVYADTAGNIGMYVAGRLPLRSFEKGKLPQSLEKASKAGYQFIPFVHNPQTRNPSQGFVASANQLSTDKKYPYYLNWRYSEPDRGNRINTRLASMQKATIDSMASLQLDNYSNLAESFLPPMLNALDVRNMSRAEQEVVKLVQEWNLRYDSDQIAPSVFDMWFHALEDTLWDELRANQYPYPRHLLMAQTLMGGPLASYLDVQNTPEVETAAKLYRASFQKTYDKLINQHGAAGKGWNWGRVKATRLGHMARVPGLGVPFVSTSGGTYQVNATGRTHGPSMRMVVDLTPPVRAYGNMPGGQSGNPGSPYYLTELDAWRKGDLIPWIEYAAKPQVPQNVMAIWQLRP